MSYLPSGFASDAPKAHMLSRRHETLSLHTQAGCRKYLDASERARFIAAARTMPQALRTLCLTLVYTGCRISEALALTGGSLFPGEGVIAFRSLKKRTNRVVMREVPVPSWLLRELQTLACEHESAGEHRLWRWGRVRAWQLIKSVMAAARVMPGPHATAKGLRHAFGIHAVRSGVPLNLVQRWLGHARMETTAIYLQAVGSEERQMAARMWSDASPSERDNMQDTPEYCGHDRRNDPFHRLVNDLLYAVADPFRYPPHQSRRPSSPCPLGLQICQPCGLFEPSPGFLLTPDALRALLILVHGGKT
jgi:hypothetical protein